MLEFIHVLFRFYWQINASKSNSVMVYSMSIVKTFQIFAMFIALVVVEMLAIVLEMMFLKI
jgi:hypothetical protein